MIDTAILIFINSFAHKSAILDHLIDITVGRPLIKAGLYTGLLWYLWFRNEKREAREYLIASVILSFAALVVARALALSLPFRVRPLHNPAIIFTPPYGIEGQDLINWSSFPSDHAALFFALAIGIFAVSRGWGIVALLYAAFVVCLPRLYAGYHYPSDLLAGAIIGIGCASLATISRVRQSIAALPLRLLRTSPAIFYTLYFFVTFEITNNFEDVRHAAHDASILLGTMWR